MTISWVNYITNPAGQSGDDYKVMAVRGADGTSSVKIGSLPHPNEGSMVFSIWWKVATTPTTATVNALGATATNIPITADWTRYYITIPSPSGTDIYITPAQTTTTIYMAMAQLEMGDTPSDWRESQDGFATKTELNIVDGKIESVVETVDSVVKETLTPGQYQVVVGGSTGNSLVALDENDATIMQITKDGFAVNSGNSTVMQITPEAFTVVNSAATDPNNQTSLEITPRSFMVNTEELEFNVPDQSLRMDGDGASMDNLTVNNKLTAPNIAQLYDGPTSITVAPGFNVESIQAVFDTLNGKIVNSDVSIRVVDDSYEYVTLSGLMGSGSITIVGTGESEPVDLHGGIVLKNNQIPISISTWNIYGGDPASSIKISGCSYVKCSNVTVVNDNANGALIYLENGTSAYLDEVGVYSNGTLMYAGPTVNLTCHNIKGSTTDGFYLYGDGARITWDGSRPSGMFFAYRPCLIAASASTLDGLTPDSGSSQPPTPTVYEATLTAYQTGSARSGNNWSSATWQSQNYIRQGAGDTDRYIGVAWFNPSTLQSGTKTVKSVLLTLRRNSDAGSSRAISVTAYSNNVTKNVSNPHSGMANETYLGTISKGETRSFSAASGNLLVTAQAIVNGTANAIVFYANDTPTGKSGNYSTNWARLDGIGETYVPTLTITYEVS